MSQPAEQNRSAANKGELRPDNQQTAPPRGALGRKRILFTRGLLLVAVVSLIIWVSLSLRQRTYNGKPESHWINSLTKQYSPVVRAAERQADREEWKALGDQAVPILLRALEMQPGPTTGPYAKLWPKLPAPMQKVLSPPMDYGRLHSSAWGKLSDQTNKFSVPPKLVARALKDQHGPVRNNVLVCLSRTILPNSGPEKDQYLTLLVGAAADPEVNVRMIAVLCLGHFKNPNVVIPVLTNALANPWPDIRIRAAMALHRLDPSAHTARVKEVANDCLKSDGLHGSGVLAAQFVNELESGGRQ